MADIVIKRCPESVLIGRRAEEIARALQDNLAARPRIEDGASGELSVFVDGVPMIQRTDDNLPSTDEVEAAVRNAAPAEPTN